MPDLFQIVDAGFDRAEREGEPDFQRGHLLCALCRRQVADAIHVPWPPHDA
jgi:hypothetical protein